MINSVNCGASICSEGAQFTDGKEITGLHGMCDIMVITASHSIQAYVQPISVLNFTYWEMQKTLSLKCKESSNVNSSCTRNNALRDSAFFRKPPSSTVDFEPLWMLLKGPFHGILTF